MSGPRCWLMLMLLCGSETLVSQEMLRAFPLLTAYAKAPSRVERADGGIIWTIHEKQAPWDHGLYELLTEDVYPGTKLLLRMRIGGSNAGTIYVAFSDKSKVGQDAFNTALKLNPGEQDVAMVFTCAATLLAGKSEFKIQVGEMTPDLRCSSLSLTTLEGEPPIGALTFTINDTVHGGRGVTVRGIGVPQAAPPAATTDPTPKAGTKRRTKPGSEPERTTGNVKPGGGGSILPAIDQSSPTNAGIPGWRADLVEERLPGRGRQPIWRVISGKTANAWDGNIHYPLMQEMAADRYYRLTMPCRCTAGTGSLIVSLIKGSPPWTGLWSETIALTTTWRTVSLLLDPTATVPAKEYRFQIQLSAKAQTVEFGEPRLIGQSIKPIGTLMIVDAPPAE